MAKRAKHEDLREAIIQEAMTIIETSGIEKLSMREVSRRLEVSHQAPYKHFPSRDHILAEIVKRSFEDFAVHLDKCRHSPHPHENLAEMGRLYVQYALEHPLQYRLMFGTPLPDPVSHPEMMQSSRHAFSLLKDAITQMNLGNDVEMDALFVFATMHGLSSMMRLEVIDSLDLSDGVLDMMMQHTLHRISSALGVAAPTSRSEDD